MRYSGDQGMIVISAEDFMQLYGLKKERSMRVSSLMSGDLAHHGYQVRRRSNRVEN